MDSDFDRKERHFEQDKTEAYQSEHYMFHYPAGSLAEKEIHLIAETQEECFARICKTLQAQYPEIINYYFTDSPMEIGRVLWDDDAPCNGVALCGRNKIYAVYNEQIKCIGAHEDTHLISFAINYPESDFVVEGLAMAMDGLWWSVPNEAWTSYYQTKHNSLSMAALLDNNVFAELGCVVTYPVAGAFTKFLIETYGINQYIKFYKYKDTEYNSIFQSIFGSTLEQIEEAFWQKISTVQFDSDALEQMLKDEGF